MGTFVLLCKVSLQYTNYYLLNLQNCLTCTVASYIYIECEINERMSELDNQVCLDIRNENLKIKIPGFT